MKSTKIQLSENQLRKLIGKSVRKALKEVSDRAVAVATEKSESFYRILGDVNEKFEDLESALESMTSFSSVTPKNKEIESILYEFTRLYDRFKRFYGRKESQFDNFQGEFQKRGYPEVDSELNEGYGDDWFKNPTNAAAYDRWRTTDPRDESQSDMINKDDFFDMIRSSDEREKREFVDYVKEYLTDEYNDGVSSTQEFLKQVSVGENPFMAAINLGVKWETIAQDFFELKPVEYYPGDLD